MSTTYNFGKPSNGQRCDCGHHEGTGGYNPGDRAALYAWFRDKMPYQMDRDQRSYLESWEGQHGTVTYETVPGGGTRITSWRKERETAEPALQPEFWYDKL